MSARSLTAATCASSCCWGSSCTWRRSRCFRSACSSRSSVRSAAARRAAPVSQEPPSGPSTCLAATGVQQPLPHPTPRQPTPSHLPPHPTPSTPRALLDTNQPSTPSNACLAASLRPAGAHPSARRATPLQRSPITCQHSITHQSPPCRLAACTAQHVQRSGDRRHLDVRAATVRCARTGFGGAAAAGHSPCRGRTSMWRKFLNASVVCVS